MSNNKLKNVKITSSKIKVTTKVNKPKKQKSNFTKEEIEMRAKLWEKHRDLFLIIYKIGNKVMLQPQLKNICKRLRLEKYMNDKTVNDIIAELEKYGMINREPWVANKRAKFIKMRDPYIRECALICEKLLGYKHSVDTIDNNNDTRTRYDWSICRAEYVLNMLNPNVKYSNNIDGVEDLLVYLDKRNSMFYQKSRGLEYLDNFIKSHSGEYFLTPKEIKRIRSEYCKGFDRILNKHCNISFIACNRHTPKRGLLVRKDGNRVEDKVNVLRSQMYITVRIDLFDTGDRRNIEALSNRLEDIILTIEGAIKNTGSLVDSCCKNCEHKCIQVFDITNNHYFKKANCLKEPFVLFRDFKYEINIYSTNDTSRDLLSALANKDKYLKNGERLDITTFEFLLSEDKNIYQAHIKENMTINFKSLGIPVKYIKGKRGESLKDYNESRAILNAPEFITKTGDTVKRPDASTVNLVQILNKLPDDTRESIVKNILDTLTDKINDTLDSSKE